MIIVPAYIAVRFFWRLVGFFGNWYIGGANVSRRLTRWFLLEISSLFKKPSVVTPSSATFWFLGAVLGAISHGIVLITAFVFYTCWAVVPPYAIFLAVKNFVL